jgi:RNA polymerase sigma factor (sigma-70 family)
MDKKTYRKIFNFVRKKLNSDLRARYLEDCVQFVCLRHLETGRSWLHLVIDFLRAEGVTTCRRSHKTPTTFAVELQESDSPLIEHSFGELILNLPDKEKEIIELLYFYEYTINEVAEKIGRSSFTVRKLRRQAFRRIKKDITQPK